MDDTDNSNQVFRLTYSLPTTSYYGYSTTAEVAAWLGVSARALRDWRRQGKGPKYDLYGPRYLYKPAYLTKYVEDVCTYFNTGNPVGLFPILGTKLEPMIREWLKATGRDIQGLDLAPKSPVRDASALLVNKNKGLSFTGPIGLMPVYV